MKAARAIVDLVLLFLLFGLPVLVSLQFLRLPSDTPAQENGQGGLLAKLERLLRWSPSSSRPKTPGNGDPAGARDPQNPAPGQGRDASDPAQEKEGSDQNADAQASFPAGESRSAWEESAAGEDAAEGPVEQVNASPYGGSAGGGPWRPAARGAGSKTMGGPAADVDSTGRRKRTPVDRSATPKGEEASDNEGAMARRRGDRAGQARVALTTEQSTGQNQVYLTNTSATGLQAVKMAEKLHLLDGAKDHAGKPFDGNWKFRKGIPIDTYTGAFGQKSIKTKDPDAVDLRPDASRKK